jgi:hypothetical protein
VNVTGWSKNLEVTADGEGIVSHAAWRCCGTWRTRPGWPAGCRGRWPRPGCWSMTGAGCWRTWRVRSLTARPSTLPYLRR